MSEPTSSHDELQSVFGKPRKCKRGKRKLFNVNSDEVQVDRVVDSPREEVEDTSSLLTGYRDLFGKPIPTMHTSTPVANDELVEKKFSRKNKQLFERPNMNRPIPICVFTPTPKIIRLLKDSQLELYSLMPRNNSLNNNEILDVSTNSINVSGVQRLLDSPAPDPILSAQKVTRTDLSNNENNKELPPVLTGVNTFVDYKVKKDHSGSGVKHRLTQLGSNVQKTFNKKVKYVVFRDGYRKTYDTAIKREIPLVSAKWVENCYLANKILNPVDYPPVDIEKYTKKRPVNYNLPKYNSFKRFFKQSELDREELLRLKCKGFMKRVKQFSIKYSTENNESSMTPDTSKTIEKPEESNEKYDILDSMSGQLYEVLNTEDSPLSDDKINVSDIPKSIKRLRQYLTLDGEKKTPLVPDDDLCMVEDHLKLNSQARQRLRKLLFFSDKELHDTNNASNISLDINDNERVSLKKTKSKLLKSISCTGMKKCELDIIKQHIKDLGLFAYQSKVVSSTKYLVIKSLKKQTLNMVFAIAFGCYIISDNWIYESHKIGKWLPHEQYLISDLPESVKEFQIQHNTICSSARFNIFYDVGFIYLAETCKPSAKTLKQLIRICGGICVSIETLANVVIGSTPNMNNNISEKWILDCITQGSLLNKCHYKLVNNIK